MDHVQITVAETVGVERRGSYYEQAGAIRDILQNHMMHLVCLVAMEPPMALDADAIRDEKVKVLRSLRPLPPDCLAEDLVRAQYAAGTLGGQAAPGTSRNRASPRTRRPRRSWPSRPSSTTGGGPACRST